jgi:hypothetical protein
MEAADVLFIFFICLLGVGGFLVLLGQFFSDEKCAGCGNLGPGEYMILDVKGRYWHYGCYGKHNVG